MTEAAGTGQQEWGKVLQVIDKGGRTINQVHNQFGGGDGGPDGTICAKVLIADDHAVFREGLRLLMEARGFCSVVLESFDAESSLAALDANTDLDLVVLDLNMPGMEDLALLKRLRLIRAGLPVVVLTASERRTDMRAAIAGGALGFIPKTFPVNQILAILERILGGERFFPADVLSEDSLPPGLEGVALSPRQKEVLTLIAKGMSNKEIARVLDTALPTVKNHVANIFEKLGTTNRVAAVNLGRKAGLIPDA
ncbi:response regulator transcription factor [Novispirillum itersonii]|uniref:DNA-binding NarL/FixJ family response regulator n=1 Tax=Novispirillum itersonii TaxID=189 RepID=A0A7W9ZHL5_NOVIT|nr:response regulator transcription factor [Novispirillum itersonii]MBB6210807.1 DNA-binding NarL/FixJ family response regulator [Novispirillum itersonii]